MYFFSYYKVLKCDIILAKLLRLMVQNNFVLLMVWWSAPLPQPLHWPCSKLGAWMKSLWTSCTGFVVFRTTNLADERIWLFKYMLEKLNCVMWSHCLKLCNCSTRSLYKKVILLPSLKCRRIYVVSFTIFFCLFGMFLEYMATFINLNWCLNRKKN